MTVTLSNPTIFVVDDDQGLLRLLNKHLIRAGYQTFSASSGQEAIEWLQSHQADLLLLDLHLPDLSQEQLLIELVEKPKLPFIVVTGQGDERVAVEIMKRGAIDYLIKDDRLLELVPTVVTRALKEIDREKKLSSMETERKRLENEILNISNREQQRIGQDLHDGLCQELAGIEFLSQLLEQKLSEKSKREAANAAEISKLIREAISHTKDLARGLSPVVPESEGLMAALEQLARRTEKLFRIKCYFQSDKPVLVENNSTATHLYRIAQEAVSNAIKHGKAKNIKIRLEPKGEQVILTIHDDGVGINTKINSKGMGLRIMNFRANVIGSTLHIEKLVNGTVIQCSFSPSGNPSSTT